MIEQWLESLRSASTKKVYMAGLRSFSNVIGVDIEEYIAKLKAGHNPFEDLLKYASFLSDKPPKTANAYIPGVINFLEYAVDFELSRKQRKQLRNKMPKGKRARTVEDDLTRDRLRKILTHCDTKGKSLFLFLESSGIRVGEALKLEFDDIDFKSEPPKINVRGEYTKSGDKYYSFIGKEALEALTEWLKIRGDYLLTSAKRGAGLTKTGYGRGVKATEDKRIFPFSFSVARAMWNNALRKAGLENHDKGTNRRTLHIHMLRKVFNSQLKLVVPKEIVEALCGHEEGMDDAYRRYTEQQIKEYYLKGEPHLYVFVPQEISKIRTHFNAELQDLKDKVNDLLYQNQKLLINRDELRSKVESLSKFVEEQLEADREAIKDLERWRQEFTKRIYEDAKRVPKGKVSKARVKKKK